MEFNCDGILKKNYSKYINIFNFIKNYIIYTHITYNYVLLIISHKIRKKNLSIYTAITANLL